MSDQRRDVDWVGACNGRHAWDDVTYRLIWDIHASDDRRAELAIVVDSELGVAVVAAAAVGGTEIDVTVHVRVTTAPPIMIASIAVTLVLSTKTSYYYYG
jgi:hypothetical protein